MTWGPKFFNNRRQKTTVSYRTDLRLIILGTTDLKDEDWAAAGLSEHPHHLLGPEDMKSVVMKAIAPMIRHHFPQLKGAEHTAYICPVISEGRAG